MKSSREIRDELDALYNKRFYLQMKNDPPTDEADLRSLQKEINKRCDELGDALRREPPPPVTMFVVKGRDYAAGCFDGL